MAQPNTNKMLADYLQSRGYSPEDVQKILTKLADKEHKTLSDAVFDSIGNNSQSLDQIIRGVLQDA